MIESITKENIIDTNDPESIEKYKSNLLYLIKEAKNKGCIDKFALIRSDDFFPFNSEWIVNSKDTNGEFRKIYYVPTKKEEPSRTSFFNALFGRKPKEEVNDFNIKPVETLKLYTPVAFRSTKHFTVNTALGMTSEYNTVESNRKFTIIDGIDNFLNSGYGYSLSERDAYLDVTHEPLKISYGAIVLISIDTYNEIKDNKELMEEMSNKRLIIYKGDINTAINMILTENGVLPTRTEFEYDSELNEIINKSIRDLCEKNNLEYNRPHGYGGHFTSGIDQRDNSEQITKLQFIDYLNTYIGKSLITEEDLYKDEQAAYKKCIAEIGLDEFKNILNLFNSAKEHEINIARSNYINERRKITPELSELFKETINILKANQDLFDGTSENDLTDIIYEFYSSPDVERQAQAASMIIEYFKEYSNQK
jgi:hypothetical protein